MPCNIGFKSYQEVYLPVPKPKKLAKKVEAPKVDPELLNKLGETSPGFVEWFNEFDVKGLLELVLNETLEGKKLGGFSFSIDGSFVVAKAKYTTDAEKKKAEQTIDKIMNEFQMRTLVMVAKLLDFNCRLMNEDGTITIEGEKPNPDNDQVSRYLRITRRADGKSEIMFEHYSAPEALVEERIKFTVLAQKLGVPIDFTLPREVGSPIAIGITHKDHLKQ
ncbi:MAG: hypothetical protein HY226_05540 [Candidatus Vogelbacteria bacterium]|nr:hypothetical protein [Candidatus Vogelbacteria bacterium]